MRILTICLAVLLLGACSERAEQTGDVRVTRHGLSVRNGTVGVGALVRASEARRDLEISLVFSADGDRVSTQRSTLPFCPASTDCWWGESYAGATLGGRWSAIDDVEIRIGDGSADDSERQVVELDVVTTDDRTEIEVPDDGTVYTIVFDDGAPVWGGFATVRDAPDRVGSQGLVSGDERMRAFLYVGAFGDAGRPGAD